MATQTVNLDALIPRDDFVSENTEAGGTPRTTLGISDLESGFFDGIMRKPDFQRETTHWKPAAVVDLIKAFLDGDLIPAVILWERGSEVFVIDGAHRLSALLAWVKDDYGDGTASNAHFGTGLTPEQEKVADRTRAIIKKEIGTYAEFKGLAKSGEKATDPIKSKRITAIAKHAIIIQWVTAATAKAAEDSFFKINQAAVPIDPVERRLLQTRNSPNAIASRCIARGGKGHKYWGEFEDEIKQEIEQLGKEIWEALYRPPHNPPITSSDLPIAGQGYNALPFVFNLVSLCNDLKIPASLKSKKLDEPLPADENGEQTLIFLKAVKKRIELVTTNHAGSLGFHPLIYYYAKSGQFLANAFLASLVFAKKLHDKRRKDDFTRIRERFEGYLHRNKNIVSLTIHRLGSGARSLTRISDLYWSIFELFMDGQKDEKILEELTKIEDYIHLKQLDIPPPSATETPSKKGASRETKSAAFIRAAMENPTNCNICGGAIHTNSVTFDHVTRVSDGGSNKSDNIKPTHPYCNSGYKG